MVPLRAPWGTTMRMAVTIAVVVSPSEIFANNGEKIYIDDDT